MTRYGEFVTRTYENESILVGLIISATWKAEELLENMGYRLRGINKVAKYEKLNRIKGLTHRNLITTSPMIVKN